MSSLGEVLSQFTDLYNAGNYQAALTLVTHALPDHPAHDAALLCFSAAMSARLGDTASALAAFRTALDKGYWYHEAALRNDPDFASLQAEAEFKTMVEHNAQRRQTASASIKPLLRVLEPANTSQPAPLLIALHGNFSHVDEYSASWQAAVDQGWRVALPQSSCPSWLSGFYDWQDMEVALNELDQHYQTLVTNYAVDPANIIIAGFSMGGLVAERVAITQRLPVRGLLWIEGAPDEAISSLLSAHQPFDFRAYFAYGQSQNFLQTAESLAQALREAGVTCQLEAMPHTYHGMPESFSQTLDRALEFLRN